MNSPEQTYQPQYIMWWENDFSGDPYVSRGMRPMHRHFYRALIIASCYNSERPYLPNDDNQLWMLADAESPEQWLQHKDVVMKKFTLTDDGKHWQHKRVLSDWQLMLDRHQEKVEKGRKGGQQRARNAEASRAQADPSQAQAGLEPGSSHVKHRTELDFDLTEPNPPNQTASSQSELAGWEGWILLPTTTDLMGIPTKNEEQELRELACKEMNGFEYLKKAVSKFRDREKGFGGLKMSPWRLFIQQADRSMSVAKAELMDSADWRREHVPGERERQDANIAQQIAKSQAERQNGPRPNEMSLEDFIGAPEQQTSQEMEQQ